jgi:hypothetical protein
MANKFTLKRHLKPWSWFDQVYRADFLLFACPFEHMRAWGRRVLKEDHQRPSPTAWGATFWLRDQSIVILWFDSTQAATAAAWHGLIAHECCHATNDVLFSAGMEHTIESDEAYAYYMGWLVEEIEMRLKLKPVVKA